MGRKKNRQFSQFSIQPSPKQTWVRRRLVLLKLKLHPSLWLGYLGTTPCQLLEVPPKRSIGGFGLSSPATASVTAFRVGSRSSWLTSAASPPNSYSSCYPIPIAVSKQWKYKAPEQRPWLKERSRFLLPLFSTNFRPGLEPKTQNIIFL